MCPVSLVTQILKEKPSLKSFILSPEAEDEEEHFSDVPLEGDCDPPMVDGEGLKEGTEDSRQERERGYRGLNRNPLYCRAEHSCLWELEKVRIAPTTPNHAYHTHHIQPHPSTPSTPDLTQPWLPHPPNTTCLDVNNLSPLNNTHHRRT